MLSLKSDSSPRRVNSLFLRVNRLATGAEDRRRPQFHDEKFLLFQCGSEFVAPRPQFGRARGAYQDLARILVDKPAAHRIKPTAVGVQDRESVGKMTKGDRMNAFVVPA